MALDSGIRENLGFLESRADAVHLGKQPKAVPGVAQMNRAAFAPLVRPLEEGARRARLADEDIAQAQDRRGRSRAIAFIGRGIGHRHGRYLHPPPQTGVAYTSTANIVRQRMSTRART